MENLEKKENDVILDGVNVSALRSLDEFFLRGEKALAKAEAGKSLTAEEEKDLCDYYQKLQLIAEVRGIDIESSENCSKSEVGVVKKIGTKEK